MIRVEGLVHDSLAIPALEIPDGETAVIGPNGAGKTTLLRILSGITLPAQGSVRVDGIPPREREVGWVGEYPDRNFLFDRVRDEIASPLRFRHLPCGETDARVQEVAEMLGIARLRDRSVMALSGGEKVLVALAAALVSRPRLLLMDEVDSHLDPDTVLLMEAALRRAGCPAVIRVTAQMESALRASHLVFLQGGKVLHQGPPDRVFSALEDTAFLPPLWRCGR
ncbi:MAG: energy-coupling factor ABC transporter ATP-binding protein [Methanomicrobiales archaeon]|nr:energy-coupling factor ABC transporter ATP-binding protein [Methanomicrobiales archaeon]MDD1660041.1 energy-coupling factor ABC transporter ATP-binding protein [Methanomicrobiales archaeon]